MQRILWDADEVLWDWLLSGVELVSIIPRATLRGDLTHKEWVLPRPGMLELLWGMRHASLERGLDAHVRVWTSGYPWRMWRITREIPGFAELIGPPFDPGPDGPALMASHPRVFARPDYVHAMTRLLDPHARPGLLEAVRGPARSVLADHVELRPGHSGLKIPELATLAGKPDLAEADVLVDDQYDNIEWFTAAGRTAVHVISRAPRIFFNAVPNSAWWPERAILQLAVSTAEAIAERLLDADGRARTLVARGSPMRPEAARPFVIEVPNAVLQGEWIRPIRAMVRAAKDASRALVDAAHAGRERVGVNPSD